MPRSAVVERQVDKGGEWAVEVVDEIGGPADMDAAFAAASVRHQPQLVASRASAHGLRQSLQHRDSAHDRRRGDPAMRLSPRAISCFVDAAAQVCECLHPIGRRMFHYATDLEAENLRHARADEIGDDDEAGVIKAAHEEVHSRRARYGSVRQGLSSPAGVEKMKPARAERMYTSVAD